MRYIEMSIEDAKKVCKKNSKVLVAIQDLEDDECEIIAFEKKTPPDYDALFEDVKTVASACDDIIKQLNLFTEKQDVYRIKPIGKEKIILVNKLE